MNVLIYSPKYKQDIFKYDKGDIVTVTDEALFDDRYFRQVLVSSALSQDLTQPLRTIEGQLIHKRSYKFNMSKLPKKSFLMLVVLRMVNVNLKVFNQCIEKKGV